MCVCSSLLGCCICTAIIAIFMVVEVLQPVLHYSAAASLPACTACCRWPLIPHGRHSHPTFSSGGQPKGCTGQCQLWSGHCSPDGRSSSFGSGQCCWRGSRCGGGCCRPSRRPGEQDYSSDYLYPNIHMLAALLDSSSRARQRVTAGNQPVHQVPFLHCCLCVSGQCMLASSDCTHCFIAAAVG